MNRYRLIGIWFTMLFGAGLVCTCLAFQRESTQIIYASDFKDFAKAVASAPKKTLVIDQLQPITSNLLVPPDVHLLFIGEGSLRKQTKDRVLVTLQASITAPKRQIFIGFEPGEILLQNGERAIPQWWGAKANDNQDDSSAIQCAIDSEASVVHIPQGHYTVNQPLNITNRPGGGLIFQGDGFSHSSGTVLHANTGGVLFDTTGSQYLEFRDFSVVGGETNPSTIGFLFARSAKMEYTKYAQFHSLTNIRVHLPSIPQANNENGTVAVYNCSAELWRAWNVYLVADQPLVFTGYNVFKVKSPFAEIWEGYPSMSECTLDGASTLHALDGSCIIVDNAIAIRIVNAYLTGGAKTKGRNPYAIHIRGPGAWTRNFTYTGHCEYSGGLISISVRAVNLRVEATGAPLKQDQPVILLDGPNASIWGGEISYTHVNFSLSHTYPLIKSSGKHGGIIGTTIHLYEGQTIDAPDGAFQNNFVRTFFPYKPTIVVEPNASYLLLAQGKITGYGSRGSQ